MRRKNNGFIVFLIILVVLVLGLSGYIFFGRLLSNDMDSEELIDDVEQNTIEKLDLLSESEALDITKNVTKKYFEYYHDLGPYCGDFDSNDYIFFGSYETRDFRDYCASISFKSIDEVREYYKSFMVTELFPKYLDNKISYLEQDGKLYCQLSHKGCGDIYNEEASYFTIHSIDEDVIVSNVILVSNTCGDEFNRREGMVTIIKNEKGDWLISKYEVQFSDLD